MIIFKLTHVCSNECLLAGFPRNRGDIEEYRSRRVRMDGVVLVDFEEEALRQFLNKEVSSGALRVSDIETELERYKQDIISVAEYYDEKELLTVVMGDQDTEEMIEDMVIAVDKIIETRKDFSEEDSLLESKGHDCNSETPYKALVPSPTGIERPSTVEIRDATEEDIKSIEAESRNSAEIEEQDENISPRSSTDENKVSTKEGMAITENGSLDQKVATPTSQQTSVCDSKQEDQASQSGIVNEYYEKIPKSEKESAEEFTVLANASDHALSQENQGNAKIEAENKQQDIPILFAFENIKTDYDVLKDLIVNEMEMCYINFHELIRNDDEEKGRLEADESLNLLQRVLKQDSVSYSSGFFISDFPFDLLKESKFEKILSLGEVSFVCKVKEKSFETEIDEEKEEALFKSPMSKEVRIIFVTESNIVNELKSSLQEIVSYREPREGSLNQKSSDAENDLGVDQDLGELNEGIDKEEKVEVENYSAEKVNKNADDEKSGNLGDVETSQDRDEENPKNGEIIAAVEGAEEANHESISEDKTSRDDHEDSTCQDVDDLITDDTLNEGTKPSDSLQTEENKDASLKENVTEDSLPQISEEGTPPVDVRREKAVLARQPNLDLETTSASEGSTQMIRNEKPADDTDEKPEAPEMNSITVGSEEEGMDGANQEVCEDPIENSTTQVASTESQEYGKDSGTENEASQDLPSVEEKKDATPSKESETECVQNMHSNDKDIENADQNELKETSNEQTEEDNIENKITSTDENGSGSQESAEIENLIPTDEMKSNQINESDNSASASKETKQDEEVNFESETKNERAQNDEDGEESEAKISDSPVSKTKEDDNSDSEIKENDSQVTETKEDGNQDSETKDDDNQVSEIKEYDSPASETKEDNSQVPEAKGNDNPVSETKEDDNPVSEAKEDSSQVSETKEDSSQVSETKEDDSQVSETKEDNSQVSETKEDDNPVSETKEDDNTVSETKEDDNTVSETREDDNPVSETKEDDNQVSEAKEDDSQVSEAKEDDSQVSETKENDNPVSETKEDDNTVSETRGDDNPVSETKGDENPDSATTNDENEKRQDFSEEIDEDKNVSTDESDQEENKENGGKSIEINNDEDENRNHQAEPSATDLENVENKKSEVEDSTTQGSAADITEEATLNEIIANKTDNDETTDKIEDGDTENKVGNGESSDKITSDEFGDKTDNEETSDKSNNEELGDKTDNEETSDKANNEEFVHKTDNEGTTDQTNNGETDDQVDNDDLADKTNDVELAGKTVNEESISSSNKISVDDKENSGTVILKSVDNDSDSNDENGEKSITIETKAEVHAPDSTSPPLVQATEKKSENTSSTFDTIEVKNDEDQKDNEDSNFLKNELTFRSTDESQLTTDINVQNERFSGKIQERNGSGILDESRHEDHPESEQQERSSSSSRGEL
ncbi:uncharacterized protein TNCT_245241 [Trichonephila clavata]|uniref:Uncharacterized protein n=1 Tax=Trichonephila clavata TaxID=2740835 RepID=A0A8X6M375_TRICU|nr:uncharacterized protein TNCT_245241 [Trichonephila clavata]